MKKEINNTINNSTEINAQEENTMKNTMKEMIMAEASEIKNEELKNLTIRVRTQRAIDALHDQWNRVCMHIDDVPADEMSEEYAEFIRKINYADRLISNASEQGELTDIDYGRNIYKKQVRTHRDSEDIHIQQFISEWDRTENEIEAIKAEIQELRDMWKAAGGYDLWEQRDEDELALSEIDLDTEERRDADTERAERESLEAGWAELIAMEQQMKEEEKQEEKEMAEYNKKQDIIDRVVSTYEVVGREETIHNCEGLNDDIKAEILGRTDVTEMAAKYIFGCSDAEAEENEKLLVSYYESKPEEFFADWTEDDILGECLVTRMAKDLLDAKAQAPEFDAGDKYKLCIRDVYAAELYRAEFLYTYRKLDIRDDEMENYLTNFLTRATAWDHMRLWDCPNGWRLLKDKFYGLDEENDYGWTDHVTDMTTWLRDLMEIATVCGTYSPNNSYRVVDYTGYDEFCLETLDVRSSVEEKIHSYESRYPYAPEPVAFDDMKDFVVKFRYVTSEELTDEFLSAMRKQQNWRNENYGPLTGYYRAV